MKSSRPGIDHIGVSAGAMIVNEAGEVFLAKRSQKAKNERGCWENPGGVVTYNEKLESAMRRELQEEYGIEVEVLAQFPAADHIIPTDNQHWVATTFLVHIKPGCDPRILEPEKCEAIGWFKLNDLPQPLSLITQHDLFYYREHLMVHDDGARL